MQISDYEYSAIITDKDFQDFLIKKGYKTISKVGGKYIETVAFPDKDKVIELSTLFLSELRSYVHSDKRKKEVRKVWLIVIALFLFCVAIGFWISYLYFFK